MTNLVQHTEELIAEIAPRAVHFPNHLLALAYARFEMMRMAAVDGDADMVGIAFDLLRIEASFEAACAKRRLTPDEPKLGEPIC